MTESKLDVPSLRKLLREAGFRGTVRAISSLGAIDNRDLLCAALFCSERMPHEVYINSEVDCDHQHLAIDVMKLVGAFENRRLDNGWFVKPNGDASTGIATLANVRRAGIPRSYWAPSPPAQSG
ncbi:hypothetical protein MTY66_24630 [Mycolicibacterium sp. TY66]|uniref:hypothetical protein n=1 Tax=unclassified Mycolicibacterium TaxID=2636767 RepID=UPI001BB347D6|nr:MULTISPECIES: hypothetical protein [unclassified Mycolicibacterium]BCI80838.1 hypothetical protein MTY66_24630 [Mycolicibacterium sp. TY66]BCJ81502.1 hypothetical protein MTY81_28750 [Mycolicibacterium sp. TY81]